VSRYLLIAAILFPVISLYIVSSTRRYECNERYHAKNPISGAMAGYVRKTPLCLSLGQNKRELAVKAEKIEYHPVKALEKANAIPGLFICTEKDKDV
jgi:hypothetical protein